MRMNDSAATGIEGHIFYVHRVALRAPSIRHLQLTSSYNVRSTNQDTVIDTARSILPQSPPSSFKSLQFDGVGETIVALLPDSTQRSRINLLVVLEVLQQPPHALHVGITMRRHTDQPIPHHIVQNLPDRQSSAKIRTITATC